MDLTQTPPERMFESRWVDDYKQIRRALYKEVCSLSTTMHLVGKIARFPFRTLYEGQPLPFWIATYYSLYESAVLGVWRLAVDTKGDLTSLGRWKGLMWEYAKGQDEQQELKAHLEKSSYSKFISEIEETVRRHRHQRIGHLKRNVVLGNANPVEPEDLPVTDLEKATEVIQEQHRLLSLEQVFPTYLPHYKTKPSTVGAMSQEDIDEMLCQLAVKSSKLNLPETAEHVWREHREKVLEWDELEEYNRYRKMQNLPPVE